MTCPLGTVFRFRTVCLIIATIVQLQNGRIWCSPHGPVCTTPDCQTIGDYYHKNMNEKGSPCTDFYDYVCHNWEKYNPRPKFMEYWNAFQWMQSNVNLELKKFLEGTKPTKELSLERGRVAYKLCMNMPSMGRLEANKLKPLMQNISKWHLIYPNSNDLHLNLPWEIDVQYVKLTGESAFFNILPNINDIENELLTNFHKLVSPYGMLSRIVEWGKQLTKNKAVNYYISFLSSLIYAILPKDHTLSDLMLERSLFDLIKFRENLRMIIAKSGNDPGEEMKTDNFQNWFQQTSPTSSSLKLNILEYIRAIYPNPLGPYSYVKTPASKVHVHQNYFTKLSTLLSKTERSVLVNHIHLYFLERHLAFDPALYEMYLEGSLVHNNIGYSDRIRYEPERWEKCVRANNMKYTLSTIYLRKFFPKEKKHAIEEMLKRMTNSLLHQISNSSWLDSETILKTKKKVNALQSEIGSTPAYDSNLAVNLDKQGKMFPTNVNVLYLRAKNLFYISAALLQTPIYSQNAPLPLNYGSTIFIIAHELYHQFDTEGITFNHFGVKAKWWNDNMRAKHEKQVGCFRDQYRKYKVREALNRNLPSNETFIDTFNEDLADVMGLKLAYATYRQKLKEDKGACKVVPGLEKFSCDQLFFIAFANVFCDASEPDYTIRHLLKNNHSLPKTRVNGAVANMGEFSKAFDCKFFDKLVLKNPCDLWN